MLGLGDPGLRLMVFAGKGTGTVFSTKDAKTILDLHSAETGRTSFRSTLGRR